VLVPRRFVERSVYRVPDGLPLEIAALAEPLACVVHGVERCDLDEPASVVVYGAGAIGLLFTAVLAARGHFVVAADPNPPRLEVARRLGASRTLAIRRGGGEAGRAVAASPGGRGFEVAIDATGVREVWMDAIASVRPGGLVNLFGGCAPGTSVPLDTHAVHYSEITVRGVYHHRPAAVREALALLERGTFDARALLTSERPLEEVEEALRSMMRKVDLKVVIRPRGL
jgi:L-iditol 2-dehydrogenase